MLGSMRRAGIIGLLLALGTGSAHLAVRVWQAPRAVMAKLETAVAEAAGGYNRCLHRRSPELRRRGIRRPNPDVLPTTVAFDLSQGALRLKGPVWSDYWSLSIYQHNSDNIFVINDEALDGGTFNIVVSLAPLELGAGTTNVVSPTARGLVVVRRLVPGPRALPALHRNQDGMTCSTMARLRRAAQTGRPLQ